ncbi:hypothetical protein GCM10007377_12120 [Galliscardovia ingluviei]|uniref:Uncharacterized protein n=1 Tax=Galliscardovia ingluviei TaxID=1769422 RepID=A0A8J3AJJ4_9BIFI|nr:hypothetical protein GCM10007377_12120 [Galliscardovia ingluviei]
MRLTEIKVKKEGISMSSPKYNRFSLQNPECGVDFEKLSQSTRLYTQSNLRTGPQSGDYSE